MWVKRRGTGEGLLTTEAELVDSSKDASDPVVQ